MTETEIERRESDRERKVEKVSVQREYRFRWLNVRCFIRWHCHPTWDRINIKNHCCCMTCIVICANGSFTCPRGKTHTCAHLPPLYYGIGILWRCFIHCCAGNVTYTQINTQKWGFWTKIFEEVRYQSEETKSCSTVMILNSLEMCKFQSWMSPEFRLYERNSLFFYSCRFFFLNHKRISYGRITCSFSSLLEYCKCLQWLRIQRLFIFAFIACTMKSHIAINLIRSDLSFWYPTIITRSWNRVNSGIKEICAYFRNAISRCTFGHLQCLNVQMRSDIVQYTHINGLIFNDGNNKIR